MLLFIVLSTVVVIGLVAIALADRNVPSISVWSDDAERQLLREGRIHRGW